jgi:16S rRNA A1518/A1519 N6-dimethyltransferase RsmA/KsgA/DIM1 with predicted DNA glycosylase/AP lyase activity
MVKILVDKYQSLGSSGFAIPNLDSQIQRNDIKNNDLQFTINHSQLTIHHQDILQFTPPYDEYSVIANIPYYITSPILFYFLYPPVKDSNIPVLKSPTEMVIMMQKEV